jgi:hypothetical protein
MGDPYCSSHVQDEKLSWELTAFFMLRPAINAQLAWLRA